MHQAQFSALHRMWASLCIPTDEMFLSTLTVYIVHSMTLATGTATGYNCTCLCIYMLQMYNAFMMGFCYADLMPSALVLFCLSTSVLEYNKT